MLHRSHLIIAVVLLSLLSGKPSAAQAGSWLPELLAEFLALIRVRCWTGRRPVRRDFHSGGHEFVRQMVWSRLFDELPTRLGRGTTSSGLRAGPAASEALVEQIA